MVFNPSLRQSPAKSSPRAWVGLSDGGRVLAQKLVVRDSEAELTVIAGQPWKTASKELVFVAPLGGRTVYLSDLKPAEYRHVPYLDLPWPYRTDRNVTGSLLRCNQRIYLKGLGVHSAARLTYLLDGSYKRFQADLGIDDSAGGRGSVGFRLFADGKPKFASGPIRGGAAPAPVSLDLTGVKRLDLVVDYGEQGDLLDHADWLNARVVK
jgi:hypothetical protein